LNWGADDKSTGNWKGDFAETWKRWGLVIIGQSLSWYLPRYSWSAINYRAKEWLLMTFFMGNHGFCSWFLFCVWWVNQFDNREGEKENEKIFKENSVYYFNCICCIFCCCLSYCVFSNDSTDCWHSRQSHDCLRFNYELTINFCLTPILFV